MLDDKNKSPAFGGQSGRRATGVGIALNPYVKVALTYVRRPFSSPQGWAVSLIFLLVGTGFLLEFLSGSRREIAAAQSRMVSLLLVLAIVLFLNFAHHVKSQFSDSRAHLTPSFRRVHATVAAAAAFLLAVVLPLLLIWLADLRSVGLVALTVFLLGMILYQATHPNLLAWLLALGVLATFATPTRILIWQFLSGEFEAEAVALLSLGAALAVLGGVRLVALKEDMPAYKPPTCIGGAGRRTAGPAQAGAWMLPTALRERLMENNMARWTNHARRASTSRWSAVCRWRVGMPDGWASWLFGVGVVLAVQFAASAWFAARGRLEPSTFFWLAFVFWLIASPALMSVSQLARRTHVLGYEIMLPVKRRTYLKQVGTAVAISWLRTWVGMGAAFMLWWITAAPEPLRLGLVVNVLACSALAQVGLFGIVLCLASLAQRESTQRLPLLLPLVGGAIGGVLALPTIGLVYVALSLGSFLGPLAGAALFALFGLLLTWFAYHRWLVADLD